MTKAPTRQVEDEAQMDRSNERGWADVARTQWRRIDKRSKGLIPTARLASRASTTRTIDSGVMHAAWRDLA